MKIDDKIDDIEALYKLVNKKTAFIKNLAKELDRAPLTLRNHWFGSFWQIPTDLQPKVIKQLEKTIKRQEKTKAA